VSGAQAPIIVVGYDANWPEQFQAIGTRVRSALGSAALRIDHVGSTAVPGLDAKPIIDVQVSVTSLTPDAPFRAPLESLGFELEPENPDRTKRYFRSPPKMPATHLHVRPAGAFDEQLNLLFRDYLRSHPETAREYARTKWALAERFRNDRPGYVRAKEPTVWSILVAAHDWAQASGWFPGPSDA
jgi:GrpB-like predicted nucleotidyltransferase (UPF0157 family)